MLIQSSLKELWQVQSYRTVSPIAVFPLLSFGDQTESVFTFFLTLRLLGFSVLSEKSIRNVYLMGQIAMEQHVYHFEGHNLQAAMAPIRFVLKLRGWKRKMPMSEMCDGDVQNCISPDTHFFMSLYFGCQSLHICCLKSLEFTTSILKKAKQLASTVNAWRKVAFHGGLCRNLRPRSG